MKFIADRLDSFTTDIRTRDPEIVAKIGIDGSRLGSMQERPP